MIKHPKQMQLHIIFLYVYFCPNNHLNDCQGMKELWKKHNELWENNFWESWYCFEMIVEINFFFPSMFCITYPARGPPWERSNTCRGFNHQQNLCMSLAPWFPPLLGLMKTIRGFRSGEGMGLIINGRFSSLAFFRFIEARLFFRRDDLKDPWKSRSGFTIYLI